MRIDENVADRRILKEWFQGTEAEDLVENLSDDLVTLDGAE